MKGNLKLLLLLIALAAMMPDGADAGVILPKQDGDDNNIRANVERKPRDLAPLVFFVFTRFEAFSSFYDGVMTIFLQDFESRAHMPWAILSQQRRQGCTRKERKTDRLADRQGGRHTKRKPDRVADRQKERQTGLQTDRRDTDKEEVRQIYKQTEREKTDRLAGPKRQGRK
uniref:Uncharacterized protein n=1 Tax=Branchiostoma floridae TaxID=7739 RepID=C3Y9P2_BRAFL|eukprot:XP_002607288.1 hypothetical protein BRAFLDRAFT_125177 [Branchiostoma floridae]